MCSSLKLQKADEKLYLPEPAILTDIITLTAKEKLFCLKLLSGKSLDNIPGQFVQVSVLGVGEAPISVTSAPRKDDTFDLGLRAVGDVTNHLHTLKKGDTIHIRGPFGHGFTSDILERMKGKHLLFIAGGTGYFPIRSLIHTVLPQKENYKKITILYGCKNPNERLFPKECEEIAAMGGNIELLETVDCDETKCWTNNIGVITTLIPQVTFDPAETIAVIYGPPIMYKFVLKSLMDRKLPKKNIYMSLERRMKCGVGKCGHCQMEGVYVCQEGPVFNYADVESNEEVF